MSAQRAAQQKPVAPQKPVLATTRHMSVPAIELTLGEHHADGSHTPHAVTVPATAVQYGKDGSIASIQLYLPLCSYCIQRVIGAQVKKKPTLGRKVWNWLIGVS